jgi:NAD-dependent SIR2 family protein deacetylase
MNNSNDIVFILGAGFSKCAGLPIQSEFTNLILSNNFDGPLEKEITKNIETFLYDIFGYNKKSFPELEDIFTCIDLSASIGHHLSIKYTPKMLRALRRMLIYRIFSIIDYRYKTSIEINKLLNTFLNNNNCSFVVLNWDIVLEKHILDLGLQCNIDYSFDATDWDDSSNINDSEIIPIYKMHGSSNWVYCENCKNLYYSLNYKLPLYKKVGLIKSDFRLFNESFTDREFDAKLNIQTKDRKCRKCSNMISTHIATFSYKKSFINPAYSYIWYEAEKALSEAKKWIFIGYSLPNADYEFKHLLKVAQLNMKHKRMKKNIDVIFKSNDNTKIRYNNFFGNIDIHYYSNGIDEYLNKCDLTTPSTA